MAKRKQEGSEMAETETEIAVREAKECDKNYQICHNECQRLYDLWRQSLKDRKEIGIKRKIAWFKFSDLLEKQKKLIPDEK